MSVLLPAPPAPGLDHDLDELVQGFSTLGDAALRRLRARLRLDPSVAGDLRCSRLRRASRRGFFGAPLREALADPYGGRENALDGLLRRSAPLGALRAREVSLRRRIESAARRSAGRGTRVLVLDGGPPPGALSPLLGGRLDPDSLRIVWLERERDVVAAWGRRLCGDRARRAVSVRRADVGDLLSASDRRTDDGLFDLVLAPFLLDFEPDAWRGGEAAEVLFSLLRPGGLLWLPVFSYPLPARDAWLARVFLGWRWTGSAAAEAERRLGRLRRPTVLERGANRFLCVRR